MNCISISYKNAGEDIRSLFAFSCSVQKEISDRLGKCVIICTCNRTELYYTGNDEFVTDIMAEYGNVSSDKVKKYAMMFHEKKAVLHLFRVACGIESMVIGEDEILGQVRDAYKNACEWEKTQHELNIIFQAALACAKKIKTETSLSSVSVSTATLAANEAAKFCDSPKVLVIGATGKIGQTTVKNLISHRNVSVTVTLRRHSSEIFTSMTYGIKIADYRERYSIIDGFDCVISATSSPHFTITYSELMNHLKTRKKRLFIDLSIPSDIDRKIGCEEDIRLIGIDYFERLAVENNALKADSAELAEKYIEAEVETVEKNLALHCFLMEKELNESERNLVYKLKSGLSAEQFSAALEAMKKE